MINSQVTKIYLVTNCYGDPNKVYIGKTKNTRYKHHKYKFGKNITYDYIDEIESLLSSDWKSLEMFWVRYFKFLGFDVQNKNEGGGGTSFHSEITKLKIKVGKKNSKPVNQFDLEGNFIQRYNSLTETVNKTGIKICSISYCVKGVAKTGGNFIWRLDNQPINLHLLTKREGTHITQIDVKGNILGNFNSIQEASTFSGIEKASIKECLSGLIKCTGKERFRFFETKNIKTKHLTPLLPKYIVYYNNTQKGYNDYTEMKEDNISYRTISCCLKNKDGIHKLYKIIKT